MRSMIVCYSLMPAVRGRGDGRRALDLACGTGVVSHLMHDLGYAVTGLD